MHGQTNFSYGARCFLLFDPATRTPIGFSGILKGSGAWGVSNDYREHRTCLLPRYTGQGLGVEMCRVIAARYLRCGGLFFSCTAHPALIAVRNKSSTWSHTGTKSLGGTERTTHCYVGTREERLAQFRSLSSSRPPRKLSREGKGNSGPSSEDREYRSSNSPPSRRKYYALMQIARLEARRTRAVEIDPVDIFGLNEPEGACTFTCGVCQRLCSESVSSDIGACKMCSQGLEWLCNTSPHSTGNSDCASAPVSSKKRKKICDESSLKKVKSARGGILQHFNLNALTGYE
jgi:hypothetical protein